jgi:hypothetical protein
MTLLLPTEIYNQQIFRTLRSTSYHISGSTLYIMGKSFRKAMLQFIDDIPDSKLEEGHSSSERTI